jgi:hypothetical protein
MLLYISASNRVVSIILVVERNEEGQEYPVQRPTYYLSKVMMESKQRYPHYQKMAYDIFFAARKLRQYFSEHSINVVSEAPMSSIFGNSDATGRVAKWAIEIAAFEITYKPRVAIKSQAIADLLVDWTESVRNRPMPDPPNWTFNFDGSKQVGG